MIIWYRNSILASIVSLSGCALAVVGFGEMQDKEISAATGIIMIVLGVCAVILGWFISERKREKERCSAQAKAQEIEDAKKTAQVTGRMDRTPNSSTPLSNDSTTGRTGKTMKPNVRFCPECGNELTEQDKYCIICGTKIKN